MELIQLESVSKQDVSLLTLVGGEDVPSVNLFIEFFDLWLHNRVSSVRVNRVCLSFGMHLCGGLISVTSWSIDFLIGLPVRVPPDLPREDIRNLLSLNIIDVPVFLKLCLSAGIPDVV